MSKIKYIIIFVSVVVILSLTGLYVSTLRQVKIIIKKDTPVEISKVVKLNAKVVTTIKKTGTIYLQNGSYCAKATNSTFDSTKTCFTVADKEKTVTVDPGFSAEHLSSLLTTEIDAITAAIRSKYSAIIDQYHIVEGQLFLDGNWYGTTLLKNAGYREFSDIYRVILNKKNGVWSVAAYPQIVISAVDYPNIPFGVLDSVNRTTKTD